ncbi:leucyl aminopeptidase [Burkholderia dolosa]|uniref:leucyl aminopeptidase n=1 Tax=Burkholderia dolosa TaxID=152500 RepID=UPI001B9E5622|nr:leucyl aminopeptidase [Burkholderia dolosa]MBR8060416.1 leucyl aminopeptidase [Burkholderia dolosa]
MHPSPETSFDNLYHCLSFHPAVTQAMQPGRQVRLLIGADSANFALAERLAHRCPSYFTCELVQLVADPARLAYIEAEITSCDVYLFYYDASTLTPPSPSGPAFLAPLKSTMTTNWRKSVLLKDYGEHVIEAFSEPIDEIAALNGMLMDLAAQASRLRFDDAKGGGLECALPAGQVWTSIDGRGNEDLVPGEIAMHPLSIEGTVSFSGTFLGTVPFARKYGVGENLLTLEIKAGCVVGFHSGNRELEADFRKYLDHNEGNRIVEELGIGTNTGIKRLYGRNAGFEERHPGLHLGLGGGRTGSHHLDLIFSTGSLAFDDDVVFANGSFRQGDRR